jgi:hypothetical protein
MHSKKPPIASDWQYNKHLFILVAKPREKTL